MLCLCLFISRFTIYSSFEWERGWSVREGPVLEFSGQVWIFRATDAVTSQKAAIRLLVTLCHPISALVNFFSQNTVETAGKFCVSYIESFQFNSKRNKKIVSKSNLCLNLTSCLLFRTSSKINWKNRMNWFVCSASGVFLMRHRKFLNSIIYFLRSRK